MKTFKLFTSICLLLSFTLVMACSNKQEPTTPPATVQPAETPKTAGADEDSAKTLETSATETDQDEQAKAAYPKVINVSDKEITLEQQPMRIAALSLDVAEAIMELSGANQLAAVPKSSLDPALSYQAEVAAQVEHQIASATSLDPEQVLSFQSDLILMTKVHHAEQDAEQLLADAGVPMISLSTWNTFDHIWSNFQVIGDAIGAEAEAAELIDHMKQKVAEIEAKVANREQPTVLIISPLGPGTGPYFIGSSNISYDIVKRAGATNSADEHGITRVTKASMEQIMNINPDYVLLIQWKEGDTNDLDEITTATGWETLEAVQQNKVKTMTVKQLFYPNRYNVDSLEEIAQWLHPDAFN